MCGNCEDCVCDKTPVDGMDWYQFHLTIDSNLGKEGLDKAIEICAANQIKFIGYNLSNTSTYHYMTSSNKSLKSFSEALLEIQRLENLFQGIRIIRRKIETPYVEGKGTGFLGFYREAHVTVMLPEHFIIPEIRNIPKSTSIYPFDQNFLKKTVFTIRHGITSKFFDDELEQLLSTFNKMKIDVVKLRKETCLYDSNENLDSNWISIFRNDA